MKIKIDRHDLQRVINGIRYCSDVKLDLIDKITRNCGSRARTAPILLVAQDYIRIADFLEEQKHFKGDCHKCKEPIEFSDTICPKCLVAL